MSMDMDDMDDVESGSQPTDIIAHSVRASILTKRKTE